MREVNVVIKGKYKDFDYKVKEFISKNEGFNTERWFCGYVRIPKGHELYGKIYTYIENISVHGGLTYGGFDDDGEYWLGFDCNHWLDNPIKNDAEYTEDECLKLIDQIKGDK